MSSFIPPTQGSQWQGAASLAPIQLFRAIPGNPPGATGQPEAKEGPTAVLGRDTSHQDLAVAAEAEGQEGPGGALRQVLGLLGWGPTLAVAKSQQGSLLLPLLRDFNPNQADGWSCPLKHQPLHDSFDMSPTSHLGGLCPNFSLFPLASWRVPAHTSSSPEDPPPLGSLPCLLWAWPFLCPLQHSPL